MNDVTLKVVLLLEKKNLIDSMLLFVRTIIVYKKKLGGLWTDK